MGSGARKSWALCLSTWATARWEQNIFQVDLGICQWKCFTFHLRIHVQMQGYDSGTFHSLWDTVFDTGGSTRFRACPGQAGQGTGRSWILVHRVTEDGQRSLRLDSLVVDLYRRRSLGKHGKGLCVPGGHRSRTDGAHRRAGLGGLWARALKHVEPPTSESDKRGKSTGNGRLHFFHRPQRFISLVRGWSW